MLFLKKIINKTQGKRVKRITKRIEKIQKEILFIDETITLILSISKSPYAYGGWDQSLVISDILSLHLERNCLIKNLKWQEYLLRGARDKMKT
jgi:hypothetical protein